MDAMGREWGITTAARESAAASRGDASAVMQEQFASGRREGLLVPALGVGVVGEANRVGSGGLWQVGVQLRGGDVGVAEHCL